MTGVEKIIIDLAWRSPNLGKQMANIVLERAQAEEVLRQIEAANFMYLALIDIQVYAEQQANDICADIQEGGDWTEETKMELARWTGVHEAIEKYRAARGAA